MLRDAVEVGSEFRPFGEAVQSRFKKMSEGELFVVKAEYSNCSLLPRKNLHGRKRPLIQITRS